MYRGRKRSLSDNFKCRTHALAPIRAPVLRSSRSLVATRGARGRKGEGGGGVFSRRRLGPRPERNLIGYLCQGAYQRLVLNGSPEWRRAGAEFFHTNRRNSSGRGPLAGRLPRSPLSSPRRKSRRDETIPLFPPSARSSRRNLRLRCPYSRTRVASRLNFRSHVFAYTGCVLEAPPGRRERFPDIFNNK